MVVLWDKVKKVGGDAWWELGAKAINLQLTEASRDIEVLVSLWQAQNPFKINDIFFHL